MRYLLATALLFTSSLNVDARESFYNLRPEKPTIEVNLGAIDALKPTPVKRMAIVDTRPNEYGGAVVQAPVQMREAMIPTPIITDLDYKMASKLNVLKPDILDTRQLEADAPVVDYTTSVEEPVVEMSVVKAQGANVNLELSEDAEIIPPVNVDGDPDLVELPKLDKKIVEVKQPELPELPTINVRSSAPAIIDAPEVTKVEMPKAQSPKVELRSSEMSALKVQSPKLPELPKLDFTAPAPKLPELNIDTPNKVEVTKVEPQVELKVAKPSTASDLPKIAMPKIPELETKLEAKKPELPSVSVTSVKAPLAGTTPQLPKLPSFAEPASTTPNLPELPKLTVDTPVITTPQVGALNSATNNSNVSINFAPNSTDYAIADQQKLDDFIGFMQSNLSKKAILKPYASVSDAQPSLANRTSLARVISVRKYLIEKGIDRTRIKVKSLSQDSSGGNPDRIDITVE